MMSHSVGNGIPLFNARVANVCLSRCGNTRLFIPALSAILRIITKLSGNDVVKNSIPDQHSIAFGWDVTPREGRVSRNQISSRLEIGLHFVTPREGRVSRNIKAGICTKTELGHAP